MGGLWTSSISIPWELVDLQKQNLVPHLQGV